MRKTGEEEKLGMLFDSGVFQVVEFVLKDRVCVSSRFLTYPSLLRSVTATEYPKYAAICKTQRLTTKTQTGSSEDEEG